MSVYLGRGNVMFLGGYCWEIWIRAQQCCDFNTEIGKLINISRKDRIGGRVSLRLLALKLSSNSSVMPARLEDCPEHCHLCQHPSWPMSLLAAAHGSWLSWCQSGCQEVLGTGRGAQLLSAYVLRHHNAVSSYPWWDRDLMLGGG